MHKPIDLTKVLEYVKALGHVSDWELARKFELTPQEVDSIKALVKHLYVIPAGLSYRSESDVYVSASSTPA